MSRPIERREALRAAFIAAAFPTWLARAFGQGHGYRPPATGPLQSLDQAARDAERFGKPLFVIIIPAARREGMELGQRWGAFLNHANSEVFLDLALCEVTCATLRSLRRHLDDELPFEREPLCAVFDPGAEIGRFLTGVRPQGERRRMGFPDPNRSPIYKRGSIYCRRPVHPTRCGPGSKPIETDPDRELSYDEFARALHNLILPDGEALDRLVAASRAALSTFDEHRVARDLAREKPRESVLDEAPALVREWIESDPERLAERSRLLSAHALDRLRLKPPAGSRWAVRGVCSGYYVEGEKRGVSVPCGTAYSAPLAKRFLLFYTH